MQRAISPSGVPQNTAAPPNAGIRTNLKATSGDSIQKSLTSFGPRNKCQGSTWRLARDERSGAPLAGTKHSRSAVIERVLHNYLREQAKAAAEARDLAILNNTADILNQEAADVLDYQPTDEQLY